jgi:hypothetical protein
MIESKFLKKEDVENDVTATIVAIAQADVSLPGAPPEMKWAAHFKQLAKPAILNSTNLQLLARILGSDNSDDWIGRDVILYNDPNVSFQGKLTGGIRVRQVQAKKSAVAAVAALEDDVPL